MLSHVCVNCGPVGLLVGCLSKLKITALINPSPPISHFSHHTTHQFHSHLLSLPLLPSLLLISFHNPPPSLHINIYISFSELRFVFISLPFLLFVRRGRRCRLRSTPLSASLRLVY